MKRRDFLAAGILGGTATLLSPEDFLVQKKFEKKHLILIEAVQGHMFPGGNTLPGAGDFRATRFLEETVMHATYDKDIRSLVIRGAEKLEQREKGGFLKYDEQKKETALRAFEQTTLGSNWLNRIMILSLEALLSDPIYGGNFQMLGWKALQTKGGEPRPATRYIEL